MKIKIPKIFLVDVTKLIRHPNNLKKHTESQILTLTKLMQMVGFKDPIVIDKKFNVKAGHGRLDAAEKLGMKQVPCIYIEGLTQKQMDQFMYLDNHVNESPWIQENIDLIFQDMPLIDLEQFPEINWDNIITQKEIIEGPVPEKPKKPKSKLWQIYELGNHKVLCGDSTLLGTYQRLFGKKRASIGFTSPPYNLKSPKKKYQNNKDSLSDEKYLDFLTDFTNNTLQYCQYSFVNIQFLTSNKITFVDWLYTFRKNIVDRIIWNKHEGQPPGGKNIMTTVFEDIIIFANEENAIRRNVDTADFNGTVKNIYDGHPNTGNEFSDIHHAVFSIDLPQNFITIFSKKDDIILDPFLGTGTTLIAAEHTNRICYGIELDPGYVDVIIQRWENFTGKKAKLLKNV